MEKFSIYLSVVSPFELTWGKGKLGRESEEVEGASSFKLFNLEMEEFIIMSRREEGGRGCALCGEIGQRPLVATCESVGEEVEEILGVSFKSEVICCYCGDCEELLKEVKRLRELVRTVTAQLDGVVAQVKLKYGRRSEVKEEDLCLEEEGISIDPEFISVKEEEEEETCDFDFEVDPLKEEEEEDPLMTMETEVTAPGGWGGEKVTSILKNIVLRGKKRAQVSDPVKSKKVKSKPKRGQNFFPCDLCDVPFSKAEELFLHEENVHLAGIDDSVESSTALLYSRVCGKASLSPRSLSAHNEAFHASLLKFLCLTCVPPRMFFSEETLKPHYAIHSASGPPFTCALCSLTFDTALHLDYHLQRVHTHSLKPPPKVKEVAREECRNREEVNSILRKKKAEVGVARKNGQSRCRFCSLDLRRNGKGRGLFGVRLHERKEHGDKFVFGCAQCGNSYGELNELQTCQEIHKKDRGTFYKCFVCNARFRASLTLREHFESKHSLGGIKCDFSASCPQRFPFKGGSGMLQHRVREHKEPFPFPCPYCPKGHFLAKDLEDHLRCKHPHEHKKQESLTCQTCGKGFGSSGGLRAHNRLKHKGNGGEFACELCGKVLKSSQSLEIHRNAHLGKKEHVCHFCGKAFVNPQVLRSHVFVHTGEKPYVCHICGKGFNQRTPRRRHLDLHKRNGTWKDKSSLTKGE